VPTRWHPEQCCACELDVDFQQTPWVLAGVFKRCEAHASVPDHALLDVVVREDQSKNYLRGWFEEHPAFGQDRPQPNGQRIRGFRDGVDMLWEHTGSGENRVLKVWLTGATLAAEHRAQMQAWLSERGYAGRVELVTDAR
jgi:hypothetical protein